MSRLFFLYVFGNYVIIWINFVKDIVFKKLNYVWMLGDIFVFRMLGKFIVC